jgi:diguanylate cyclase (GGDEF)-like protein
MDKDINILVIDDSDSFKKEFELFFQNEINIHFNNAQQPNKILNSIDQNIDIIFMGINLISASGLEIITIIKNDKTFCEIPIIMIAGKDDELFLKKALATGADDYISKPFNKTTLQARIKITLKLKKEITKQILLSRFDPLTKLPNRLYFKEQLSLAMKRALRNDLQIAVLVADLDHFKRVNDTFGHSAGDKLLIEISKRMQECVRETDTIARMSGDEFFIILENIDRKSTVIEIVERLINSVKTPFVLGENEAYVGLSIGISLSDPNITSEILVRNADIAMYDVKEHGRNNYKFFTEKMNNFISKKVKLCKLLYDALDDNQFELNYQPKINIKTNQITGVEALLRWNHPENEFVPSDIFIPFLEEIGLINQIGDWVVRKACQQNALWQKQGLKKIPISVNISPIQFHDEKLSDNIRAIVEETELDPKYLEIEINEGVFVVDDDIVKKTLRKLKEFGLNMIIMDDFGSGYSSIGYLKKFPIDAIKIERTFVQNITDNPSNAALVSAIAAMGIALELKSVIAVGVENESQIPFLRHMGCDSYQGFLSSPPVSSYQIENMLKNETFDVINNHIPDEKSNLDLNLHILFVDDFPTNIQIALKLLQNSGYKIDTAIDGKQAVDLFLNQGPYDLIFMDLQMPKFDGYEATKKIRESENNSRVPIIAMTAYDMEGVRNRCLSTGMDDFIAKPFRLKDFNEIIEKWKSSFSK